LLGGKWEVRNFGVSGSTLLNHGDKPYQKEGAFKSALAYKPDVVVIMLGTNDTKPQNWKHKDEFAADYKDLIRQFAELPSKPRIFICRPVPVPGSGNYGINESGVKEEIPVVDKVAEETASGVIDMHAALADHPETLPDRVHPNSAGAAAMALAASKALTGKESRASFAGSSPLPSPRQLKWHEMEFYGFLHFTVNTFTDREWGNGDEPESAFNPTDFDADQIARTATEAGMKGLILTCKHHDGFRLWPSKFTEHSIKNSPWKNGKGDVVKEISDACRRHGLKFGVYLSPWDRSNKDYARPEYIIYYRNQLRELLTNYGPIFEVWFDGANGGDGYYGGARGTRHIDNRTYYDWPNTIKIVRELQPDACIFSDAGPDIRWVGNESGSAGDPCWATVTADDWSPGHANPGQLNSGVRDGKSWMPAEADVSIRPGWFWHSSQNGNVRSPENLVKLYFQSVGHGSSLNLNMPPDRRGRINEEDVKSLQGFRKLMDKIFETDVARSAKRTADGNEVTLTFEQPVTFNVVRLREDIRLGQRVDEFSLDAWTDGKWQEFYRATAIGSCRLALIQPVATDKVRLRVTKATNSPVISEIALFDSPDLSKSVR
jgi:alpha-L-fucosidase